MVIALLKSVLSPSKSQSYHGLVPPPSGDPRRDTAFTPHEEGLLSGEADAEHGLTLSSNSICDARLMACTSSKRQSFDGEPIGPDAIGRAGRRTGYIIDPRVVADATIGLSDGLTVPFALTAGLAALGNSKVVVYGGLAELIAGSISMGLGGYLAARSEREGYDGLVSSTRTLVTRNPDHAIDLLQQSLAPLGIDAAQICSIRPPQNLITRPPQSETSDIVESSSAEDQLMEEDRLTSLLLRYVHLQPSGPTSRRAYLSGLTIAMGYFLGGFIPLLPYLYISKVSRAFWWSVAVMVIALAAFGGGKSTLLMGRRGHDSMTETDDTGYQHWNPFTVHVGKSWLRHTSVVFFRGAAEMVILGGVAACAAMGLVSIFNGGRGLE